MSAVKQFVKNKIFLYVSYALAILAPIIAAFLVHFSDSASSWSGLVALYFYGLFLPMILRRSKWVVYYVLVFSGIGILYFLFFTVLSFPVKGFLFGESICYILALVGNAGVFSHILLTISTFEKPEERPPAISDTALVSYYTIGWGIVGYILLSIIDLGSMPTLADFLLLAISLAIIGFVFLIFVILKIVNYFGADRHKVVGLTLGVVISLLFILTHIVGLFEPIEEFSIDARFRLSAGQIQAKNIDAGVSLYEPNPRAHKAIQIIGIDQQTVNAYEGYPFSWKYYAKLLQAMEGSKLNTVMFDIFFLDESKDNYGLRELAESLQYQILQAQATGKNITLTKAQIKKARAYLSTEMKKNGKVVVDYPFETSPMDPRILESDWMQERLKYLNKYVIQNVVPTPYMTAQEWVDHPEPPIARIGKVLKGMGFANIRKNERGVNRKMPLVIKWRGKLYPSIDLMLVCRYYGIDVTKDVEVKLGSYIKLMNIPKKQVQIGVTGEPEDVMVKPNEKRTIIIPIDEEGFMYINFIGGPWSFPAESFVDIASSERGDYGFSNPDYFRDKILLVAMYYATGVAKDIHTSPFGDMACIGHHANALNTILQQDFIYFAKDWVNFLIYIFIGLFVGLIVPRVSLGKAMGIVSVFAVAFLVEVFFVFNSLNYVHIFFTPYIEMALVTIAIVAYRGLTEEENVKYIRSTFSKFVSKDVVNELLANPESLKLGGEKKEITVFFSDIRGFTTISESLNPEELVSLLNEYLSTMTEIVLMYKGTVDKYMGDAIMAFWGAPVHNPDHPYLACLASLKQIEELQVLQEKWKSEGKPPIDIGIGLNTGDAVVGNMGSSHRMDYTVMGDTINLGSRLEGTNKVYKTRIIISEYTYERVKDKVYARELDLIRVKGKHEPVRIYELLDVVNREDFETYKVHEE
ncbi:MAG: CHASE2 domain-containing protein [Candidatus Hydrogenedentota bacterium]|nr:MAG: CHASE2 domain-containing protein [Candidatus Hydrogenedentota bacterium]